MRLKETIMASRAKIGKQILLLEELFNEDLTEVEKVRYKKSLIALKQAYEAVQAAEEKVLAGGRKRESDYNKIIKLRDKGLTQPMIAERLNVSIATVSRAYRADRIAKGIRVR